MRSSHHLRPSMLIVCLMVWGALASCGELHFVISPYAARDIRVVYSEQEDLTIVAWKLAADVDSGSVRFELFQNGQWAPLNFDAAPFPAGEFDCPTTCFQYNLPGRYAEPANRIVLRSIHPEHGTVIGTAAAIQTNKITLSFEPRMKAGNHNADLNIADFFDEIGTPEKRTYQYRFLETTTYPCPTENITPWSGSSQGADPTFYPLGSNSPYVCTYLQPAARHAFKAVTLNGLLWMHPELQSRQTTYNAPVETSPVLYQLLFDLQIPDESHCASTIESIRSQIALAFKARSSEVHEFEFVNISDDGVKHCHQSPNRSFPSVDVAERIKTYVNTSVSQPRGARIVIVYINNNGLTLPNTVVNDYWRLIGSIGGDPRIRLFTWAIGTDAILQLWQWDQTSGWITPSNAAFKEFVAAMARSALPFKSLNHDSNEQIRFIAPEFDGIAGQYKSCGSTPDVTYFLNDWEAHSPPGYTTFFLSLGDRVTFKVFFPPQEFVKSSEFVDQKVLLRYEICTKWCDHPFFSNKDEWIGSIQGTSATSPGTPLGWNREVRCREAP